MSENAIEIIDEEKDKEERKIQRRKRLDQSLKSNVSKSSGGQDSCISANESKSISLNLNKVNESATILANKKFNAIQSVTDVRVVTDGLEAKRREIAELKLKERIAKLEQETYNSASANSIIQSKWTEILELHCYKFHKTYKMN